MNKKSNGTNSSNQPQLRIDVPSTAKERVSGVDPYGFERSDDFDYESYEDFMSDYLVVLTRRSIRWSKLLQGKSHIDKNVKIKRYIRKGIPNEHRALIWMAVSGSQEQMEKKPGYYQSLLQAQHDPKLMETIRTDLHRTFPDNVQFRKTADPCLQKVLYNVLLAYGHHNKDVGYCQVNFEPHISNFAELGETLPRLAAQSVPDLFLGTALKGMNFIAGYLILITKDEEKSFWLMEALLDRILPDYYTPAMLGLKTDQEVLGELVKAKTPAVWQAMVEHNVMWTLVVSRWFICLFIDILPVETVLRIWDCLFYEGSKILFRVALTLIHHNQADILQAQNLPDICDRFKQITKGAFVEDCHAFMEKIFKEPGSLSMTTIAKMREACRARIMAEES